MRPKNHVFLAFLALTIASLACQTVTGTETVPTQESQQPESTEAPLQQATVEPATVTSQGAGIACIGSRTGLSCLIENGWQVYTDENSDLPNNYLYAGTACPDGQLAIAHINGIALFDGTTFKQIPEMDTASSPEGVACDASGGIWVAHFQGVSYYANGQWTTYGADQLASGESANELVYDVEVAPDGKAWVVTSRSVALFENNTWTIFQEGQGFDGSRFFSSLALDANGRPWAAHSTGMDVFENGAWQSYEKTDYNTPESLAIDAQGGVWFGTISDGAFVFDGNTWSHYDAISNNVLSNHIRAVTTDSGGRVWLGTTYGLSVFDGANWQTYLMSNSSLIDNDIEFVIVTKDGPALPAIEQKENGSITGNIEHTDGTPLANARIEICVETLSSTFSGDTPCSDQPFFLSATTDANGAFAFENVPTGYYVVVAETNSDNWAQLTDEFGISSERTLIKPGEQYDFEKLTIEQ